LQGWQQTVDVYVRRDHRPQDGRGAPVFFFVHGGGWIIGDKLTAPYTLFARLLRDGWIVVSCNYRLAPRVALPELFTDVKRALAWVKTEVCTRFGGDPAAVACGGESAGGHLALMLAVTANERAFQPDCEGVDTSMAACVDLYGLNDLADSQGHYARRDHGATRRFLAVKVFQRPWEGNEALYQQYTPSAWLARRPAEALPPFLLVHGGIDNLVPVEDSQAFFAALQQRRAQAAAKAAANGAPGGDGGGGAAPDVLIVLPTAHHSFNWVPSPRTLAVDEAAAAFLRRTVVERRPVVA